MEEPLLSLHPKNDSEKLLWEAHKSSELSKRVKTLQLELGMTRAELDEMHHLMKTEQIGALILKNKKLKELNIDKDNRIKDLKRKNEKLLLQIINLQSKRNESRD